MRLVRFLNRLTRQLTAIDDEIDNTILGGSSLVRLEKWALQEGFVSQKWQAWCGFCRSVILASACGATTTSGAMTSSPHAGRPDAELAWIAARAARNESYTNVKSIVGPHQEPTWGDVSKISLITLALGLSNEPQITSGILGVSTQARHLQIVRNATAHISQQGLKDTLALAANYRASPIISPSDAMLWEDPTTNDFAYRLWSDRLITGATLAVS